MTGTASKNATAGRLSPRLGVDPGPARGVLSSPPSGDGQPVHVHRRLPPSPRLAPWVQHYWFVAWDRRNLPAFRASTLPHPNVHLVVRAGACGIHGVHATRFETVLSGCGKVFGIKFRPGGFRAFLGAPVAGLWNRTTTIGSVFGADGEHYEARVLAADEVESCIELAEALLMSHLPAPDPQLDRAAAIVDAIVDDRELCSVEQLSATFDLTVRALQRLFREYVGATPKWVINRYRLHEAVEQLRAGRSLAWSELAQTLGYFDQAHFNRDFRRLVGCTPAQYEHGLRVAAGGADARKVTP